MFAALRNAIMCSGRTYNLFKVFLERLKTVKTLPRRMPFKLKRKIILITNVDTDTIRPYITLPHQHNGVSYRTIYCNVHK